ncbi:MAG: GNAT family N-acetyltransferase [bacterium]
MGEIREAAAADLPAINDIYNHYVLSSTCTYETQPTSLEARERWFAEHASPWVVTVYEVDGQVVGWASLSQFRPRAAYAKTVENSVYLHPHWLGKGIGKALLVDLVERARAGGFHTMVALISADQPVSLRLHERLGFAPAGLLREAGHKFGRWLDVAYWQLILEKGRA